jgi:hypothetical protein
MADAATVQIIIQAGALGALLFGMYGGYRILSHAMNMVNVWFTNHLAHIDDTLKAVASSIDRLDETIKNNTEGVRLNTKGHTHDHR